MEEYLYVGMEKVYLWIASYLNTEKYIWDHTVLAINLCDCKGGKGMVGTRENDIANKEWL